jgi:excisionase family DNA binding protein
MKIEENRLRLVTVKEAGAYARMGKTRLFQLMAEGKITYRKNGRTTLVSLDSIDDYLASLPTVRPRKAA